MEWFYARSTGGFYCKEVHGENIPSDAVSVTEEEYKGIMTAHATGKVIAADADGRPQAVDPPGPSVDAQAAVAAAAAQAQLNDLITQAVPSIVKYIVGTTDDQAAVKEELTPINDQITTQVTAITTAKTVISSAGKATKVS